MSLRSCTDPGFAQDLGRTVNDIAQDRPVQRVVARKTGIDRQEF